MISNDQLFSAAIEGNEIILFPNKNPFRNPADEGHGGAETAELPKNPRDQNLQVLLGAKMQMQKVGFGEATIQEN